jgi:type I site-specific restriction-modification system R (restriction) subunit
MFRVHPSRINVMRGMISSFARKKRHTVRTPSEPHSIDKGLPLYERRLMECQSSVYGLFDRGNLLDIIRNFIVFETEQGKLVKKVARYQQFRAANKLVERALSLTDPSNARRGIVWHTQGSGKSLTMIFAARKLWNNPTLQQPTVIIVVDREQLEEQMAGTLFRTGTENVVVAGSRRELRELLARDRRGLILTLVHKFDDMEPLMTNRSNVIMLVDEALDGQFPSYTLDENYLTKIKSLDPNAKALDIEGMLDAEIRIRLDEDEDVRPLSERLKRIIEQKRAGTLAGIALLKELEDLTTQVVDVIQEAQIPVRNSIAKEIAQRVDGISEEKALQVADALLKRAKDLCFRNWYSQPHMDTELYRDFTIMLAKNFKELALHGTGKDFVERAIRLLKKTRFEGPEQA